MRLNDVRKFSDWKCIAPTKSSIYKEKIRNFLIPINSNLSVALNLKFILLPLFFAIAHTYSIHSTARHTHLLFLQENYRIESNWCIVSYSIWFCHFIAVIRVCQPKTRVLYMCADGIEIYIKYSILIISSSKWQTEKWCKRERERESV